MPNWIQLHPSPLTIEINSPGSSVHHHQQCRSRRALLLWPRLSSNTKHRRTGPGLHRRSLGEIGRNTVLKPAPMAWKLRCLDETTSWFFSFSGEFKFSLLLEIVLVGFIFHNRIRIVIYFYFRSALATAKSVLSSINRLEYRRARPLQTHYSRIQNLQIFQKIQSIRVAGLALEEFSRSHWNIFRLFAWSMFANNTGFIYSVSFTPPILQNSLGTGST